MTFALHSFNIKYHQHLYKILMLINSRNILFIQEELTFKNFEQKKIILKIKSDLRTVINLIDWTHISRAFLESNIKTIKRVEGIQTYKLSGLVGYKLQHDPKKKEIHNFSSYQLSDTEKLLYCVKV